MCLASCSLRATFQISILFTIDFSQGLFSTSDKDGEKLWTVKKKREMETLCFADPAFVEMFIQRPRVVNGRKLI